MYAGFSPEKFWTGFDPRRRHKKSLKPALGGFFTCAGRWIEEHGRPQTAIGPVGCCLVRGESLQGLLVPGALRH